MTDITYLDPYGVGHTVTIGGGSSTLVDVNQVAHGFVAGDLIRFSGSVWVKSKADTAANSEVDACVAVVTDADNFTYEMPYHELNVFTGLTPGTTYFLDPSTAGAYTATEPTTAGQITKPVLRALTTTNAEFISMRGFEIGATPGIVTVTSATYTVTETDELILVNPSPPAEVTITLLAGASHLTGKVTIKDKANMATSKNITVVADGAETIDGEASIIMDEDRMSLTLWFSGTEWSIT